MPFEAAPFGVTGLETAFAALYTHLVEPGLLPLETLLERMSRGPRAPTGSRRRGSQVGAPANLVLLDPGASWRVAEERLPLALGELLAARRRRSRAGSARRSPPAGWCYAA